MYSKGEMLSHISPTVFKNNTIISKKYKYETIDTRLVKCFNKLCKNSNTKVPKCFHFACYQHMITNVVKQEMDMLEFEGVGDKIVDQIVGITNMKEVELYLEENTDMKLIFPVCGKRCFNIVSGLRNKVKPKDTSDYSNSHNWDNDGNEVNRSSIKFLLDWLTTEENASSYFGGVDSQGRTSDTRKDGYHHLIRDLIKKENGKNVLYYTFYYLFSF